METSHTPIATGRTNANINDTITKSKEMKKFVEDLCIGIRKEITEVPPLIVELRSMLVAIRTLEAMHGNQIITSEQFIEALDELKKLYQS